jgi:hypothetical protein
MGRETLVLHQLFKPSVLVVMCGEGFSDPVNLGSPPESPLAKPKTSGTRTFRHGRISPR